MQQDLRSRYIIISCVATSILSFVCFVILGTFYKAINHSVGLNVIVWILTVILGYMIYYGFHWLIKLFFKSAFTPKLYNIRAILSGLVTLTLVCLFTSQNSDEYLFLEVMGTISSVAAIFELVYSIRFKKKKEQ